MRISVAIATYNGEKYLADQLASILAQTRLPDEIVVSDDGSSDGTIGLVGELQATAPVPIRLLVNDQNLGYGANFLRAAFCCSGDWIAFCDQDDFWFPEKLEYLESLTTDCPADVLVVRHAVSLTDADLKPVGFIDSLSKRLELVDHRRMRPSYGGLGSAMFVKREMVELFSGETASDPERIEAATQRLSSIPIIPSHGHGFAHDFWLFQLAGFKGRVALSPRVLGYYRRHEKAVTGVGKNQQRAKKNARFFNKLSKAVRGANPRGYLLEAEWHAATVARFEMLREWNTNPGWSEVLSRAEAHFREITTLTRLRSRLYAERRYSARAACYAQLVAKNYYAKRAPDSVAAMRHLIKDAVLIARR